MKNRYLITIEAETNRLVPVGCMQEIARHIIANQTNWMDHGRIGTIEAPDLNAQITIESVPDITQGCRQSAP